MRRPGTPDRRSVILGAALVTGLAGTGCAGGGRRLGEPAPSHTSSAKPSSHPSVPAKVDRALREAAVTQQQRLLTACAAPAGREPFATLRTVHVAHLHRLTGSAPNQPAASARSPMALELAAEERTAAAQLRAGCLRASPELAPLLASMAASSEIAALLLTS